MFSRTLIVVFLFLFLCASTQAEVDKKAIEQEVLQSFEALLKASKSLDSTAYFQLFNIEYFVGLNAN